jgi:hypothetical protein
MLFRLAELKGLPAHHVPSLPIIQGLTTQKQRKLTFSHSSPVQPDGTAVIGIVVFLCWAWSRP